MIDPDDVVACSCGAAGDAGEIAEHAVAALTDAADTRTHDLDIPDPPLVAEARAERDHRDRLRQQLETATGLTATEIVEALRGL